MLGRCWNLRRSKQVVGRRFHRGGGRGETSREAGRLELDEEEWAGLDEAAASSRTVSRRDWSPSSCTKVGSSHQVQAQICRAQARSPQRRGGRGWRNESVKSSQRLESGLPQLESPNCFSRRSRNDRNDAPGPLLGCDGRVGDGSRGVHNGCVGSKSNASKNFVCIR